MHSLRLGVLILAAALSAAAHDLWMIAEGKRLLIRIGEDFPVATGGLTADRIVFLRAVGGAGVVDLAGKAEDKQFAAPLAAATGPMLVELEVEARPITLPAADFNRYIEGEGLDRVIAARKAARQTETPGNEMYSRYAKLLIDGPGNDRHLLDAREHRLEIVPDTNPARLPAGAPLTVRVFYEGRPLPGALVSAGPAGMKGHKFPTSGRTDIDGRVRLAATSKGLWYIRLIHMVESAQPGADWRSFFATLTFER